MNTDPNKPSIDISDARVVNVASATDNTLKILRERAKQKLIDVVSKLVEQSIRYHEQLDGRDLSLVEILNSKSVIALDVKRFLTVNENLTSDAGMSVDEAIEYLFNYSYREGEEQTLSPETIDKTRWQVLWLKTSTWSVQLSKGGFLVDTDMEYKRNPKPKITVTGSNVLVETPVGMWDSGVKSLAYYPEIVEEMYRYVRHKYIAGEGITE